MYFKPAQIKALLNLLRIQVAILASGKHFDSAVPDASTAYCRFNLFFRGAAKQAVVDELPYQDLVSATNETRKQAFSGAPLCLPKSEHDIDEEVGTKGGDMCLVPDQDPLAMGFK